MTNATLDNIKIREAFNSCPGGDHIKTALEACNIRGFMVEDADWQFWQNEPDTLVFSIPAEGTMVNTSALRFAASINDFEADEFHTRRDGNKIFIRIWWD